MPSRLLAASAGAAVVALAAAVPASAQVQLGTGTVLTDRLNARTSPGSGTVVAHLRAGSKVTITCQRNGPLASGRHGLSTIWDRVRVGSRALYVADGHLTSGTSNGAVVAALCGAPAQPQAPDPTATSGPCAVTPPVDLVKPFTSHASFVAAAVPGARQSQQETGVPAAVTLAQAILETGWGTLTAGANNFFGMKAQPASTPGTFDYSTVASGCILRKTREVVRGRSVTELAAFRAYDSLADSIRDHGLRLRLNPIYAAAFGVTADPEQFARVIARHYATDPAYGAKLVALMRSQDLERYDAAGTDDDVR